MLIQQFKEALPYLMKARITAMLIAHHGVGKSAGTDQVAVDWGWKLFNLRAGTQETGDLIGLADFVEKPVERTIIGENGESKTVTVMEKIATRFMKPDWLKELLDYCEANPDKGAIIFIDEINRARPDVLQALFQLVLDYRMHTVELPKNCYVLAAMNPDTEDYNVTNMDDKALLDRFCHIKISPAVSEWLEYAKKVGMKEEVINYIMESPEALKDDNLIPVSLDFVKPSARSWDAVNRLIDVGTPPHILQELLFGIVGSVEGIKFMNSLKDGDKPLTGEMIVKEFPKYVDKMREHSEAATGGRGDIIFNTCNSLLSYSTDRQELKKKYEPEEIRNIQDFLITIPVEHSFNLCKKLYHLPICRPIVDTSDKVKDILMKSRAKAGMAVN